ncbi:m-AAA protease-interacting protein 1, mitochondrial [Antennarius striatus]|uniref:m-AAA protease-interacting protein 1, mitochondrial n=1 Tax=Antennarius striatus TaxID=241820 RepID=UPI0035B47752
MAFPLMRGCTRVRSAFSFTRLVLRENIIMNRIGNTRKPSPTPAAVVASAPARPYSSDPRRKKLEEKESEMMRDIIKWIRDRIRARIQCFLIWVYFDKDFNIKEFTAGAMQAFVRVSGLLSECKFDALEGLVAKDLIGTLEEKCNLLPLDHRNALFVRSHEVMFLTPEDVQIYNDDERQFVCILMRFWYLTSVRLPDSYSDGHQLLQRAVNQSLKSNTKTLLAANYEFKREYTKGVPPDWTITKIEYSKILD